MSWSIHPDPACRKPILNSVFFAAGLCLASASWAQDQYRVPGAQRCAVVDCSGTTGSAENTGAALGNAAATVVGKLIGSFVGGNHSSNSTDKYPWATKANALNDQAVVAANTGNFVLAANLLQQALTLSPYDHTIRGNLADMLLGLAANDITAGDDATAANLLERALKLPPRNGERNLAVRNLAIAYKDLAEKAYNAGDVLTAIIWLNRALPLNPNDDLQMNYLANACNQLALKAYSTHDIASSTRLFQQVVALNSNDHVIPGNIAFAYNGLSVIALKESDYATALRQAQKALALQPNQPVMQGNLALAYNGLAVDAFNAGDYQKAMGLFQKALASYPPDNPNRQIVINSMANAQSRLNGARSIPAGGLDSAQPTAVFASANSSRSAADAGLKDAVADNAKDQQGGQQNPGANTAEGRALAKTPVPNPQAPTAASSQELLRNAAAGGSLNKLYDNGRAADDLVFAKVPNVATPTSSAPLDPRLTASEKYWGAARAAATANASAEMLNAQMKALTDEQQAHPTPERQIQISNLSGPVAAANGAASIAQNKLDAVKQTIIGPPIIVDGPALARGGPVPAPVPSTRH